MHLAPRPSAPLHQVVGPEHLPAFVSAFGCHSQAIPPRPWVWPGSLSPSLYTHGSYEHHQLPLHPSDLVRAACPHAWHRWGVRAADFLLQVGSCYGSFTHRRFLSESVFWRRFVRQFYAWLPMLQRTAGLRKNLYATQAVSCSKTYIRALANVGKDPALV